MTDTVDSTGRVIFDIILLVSFLSMVIYLPNVKPFERGFFCDDESIKYPFMPETISFALLLTSTISVACVTMILTELTHYVQRREDGEASTVSFCGIKASMYAVQLYKAVIPFAFALVLNLTVWNVIKISVGRLRPYFLTACRPNMSAEMCMENGYYKYVTNYTCMNTEDFDPILARTSFPSGHSLHSFACAVYLIMYLQARMTWKWSQLPRRVVQVIALLLACYVCVSRLSDYKHHSTDVLGGAVQGTLIALIVGYFFSDLFHKMKTTAEDPPIPLSEYDRIK